MYPLPHIVLRDCFYSHLLGLFDIADRLVVYPLSPFVGLCALYCSGGSADQLC